MTLTQTSIVDQIIVELNGIILVRTSNVITDGTAEIAQSYSRTSFVPGQDLTEQPNNVVAIAKLTWTPEIISAYQTQLAAQTAIPQSTTNTGA